MMERDLLAQTPTGVLADAIRQLYGLQCAVNQTLFELIAAYDNRQGHVEDGATSMGSWLAAHLAVTQRTGAEYARMAAALEELPQIADRFGNGELSFDQTAALTKFATPDTDAALAVEGSQRTPRVLERWAARERRHREQATPPSDDPADRLWLNVRHTNRETVRVNAELPAADGATVIKTLERVADQIPEDPETGQHDPWTVRMAHALIEVCSLRLGADTDADRATVVLYADTTALHGGSGTLELEGGIPIDVNTAIRMSCDCRLETVITDPCGHPIGIGRADQEVPRWLRRQVLKRDDYCCTFPGCSRTRWLECHHRIWWSNGGRTDYWNLVTVCRYHHNLVHKHDWRIIWSEDREPVFLKPDGTIYRPQPEALRPGTRAWLNRIFGTEDPEPDDTS